MLLVIGLAVCIKVNETKASEKKSDTKSSGDKVLENETGAAFVLSGKEERKMFKSYVIPGKVNSCSCYYYENVTFKMCYSGTSISRTFKGSENLFELARV